MSIDLRNLSAKELGALIAKAKEQQTKLAKRTPIATVRGKITKFAKAEGYTLDELFGTPGTRSAKAPATKPGPRAGKKLGKVAPKYRNPANPKETWTGRGKHPRWMAALIAKGKKADDFLIRKK
ncbi:MAG: DNA-binding protein [Stenotrophomonas acidaminiphila]|jgi:DNA-binding protein H-NS|uniref:DNA-binding protein n=1 Tax=Pseudoxanthomonas japonensis TaxID=69284 RepID=A0ABQ6ZJ99_9GAMM|nr:DNA-binding protein [Pseudoxanthomonas japonensis]NCT70688.1 H-NS histone family protein [Xanthomonadaceae bacterium]PZQ32886.1 MAG: DNA-binding protein [Stenotrophomonas acidaminiphila]